MGSKERLDRVKEEVHNHILDAAMEIVKNDGCQCLSIRKIADSIEYSPPIIYSYFLNKEAVLIELSKRGYAMLIDSIKRETPVTSDPKERLEKMLVTYLNFATKEKELYQLMYTVGTGIADVRKAFPGLDTFIDLFRKEMKLLTKGGELAEAVFQRKYFTFVAFVHGLVSVNLYFKDIEQDTNDKIMSDALKGLMGLMDLSA
jgi:AcrR family transcriptional regulator